MGFLMQVGVIGVNFKCASLSLREKLAKITDKYSSQISLSCPNIVLSTCNRIEIYFSACNLAFSHTQLLAYFQKEIPTEFSHKLYSYFGADCFLHLAKVTIGLDSAIILETEIQGQVKRAYQAASNLNKDLHFIFQKSLKIGKEIRSMSRLNHNISNLPRTISKIAHSFFTAPKALFIGASSINFTILSEFESSTLITRSQERAQKKALEKVSIVDWGHLKNWEDYDVIVIGTTYFGYLFDHMKYERRKVIFDLSVPRNVHPKLGYHDLVELYNIDQLNSMVRRERKIDRSQQRELDFQVNRKVFKQEHIFQKKKRTIPLVLSQEIG
jgi:glutamyl-tRNA reductase